MENQAFIGIVAALAAVPTMITVLIGILINNARMSDMNARMNDMNARMNDMNGRLGDLRTYMDARFDHIDARFDDMRDTWRSELRRVEEVIDARLKHLEEQG